MYISYHVTISLVSSSHARISLKIYNSYHIPYYKAFAKYMNICFTNKMPISNTNGWCDTYDCLSAKRNILMKKWQHFIGLMKMRQHFICPSIVMTYRLPLTINAVRFGFRLYQLLWHLTGTSASALSRCLWNVIAIRSLLSSNHSASRLYKICL